MKVFKQYLSIILKHSALVGLFIAIPLMVSLFLGLNIINAEQNNHIQELSTKINNNLDNIESESTKESFVLKVARGAWYIHNKNKGYNDSFWNYYDRLCKFIESEPEIYAFDENGKIVTPQRYSLKSKFLASKLWNSIYSNYEEKEKVVLKYKKQFKSLFGNEFKYGNFLEGRNNLIPIIVNTKTSYVYWTNFSENSKEGMMIIFWDIPSFKIRLKEIINRNINKFDDLFIRNKNEEIESFISSKATKKELKNYEKIYFETVLKQTRDYFIDSDYRLWRYSEFEDTILLGCLKSNIHKFRFINIFYICFIIILSIISIVIYTLATRKKDRSISIRIKLIIIFLIAVLTPVLGFSYLAYQYISDMRDNLKNKIRNESKNILLNIDRELGNSGNVFLKDFKKMVKDFQHYDEDINIRKYFDDSIRNNDLAEIDRRSVEDASSIKQLINNVNFESMNVFTEPFSKCCIDKLYNKNLMDSVDPGLKAAMLSPEGALSSFYDRPDNVQDFVFGPNEFYLYWCILKNEKNGDEFFFILRDYNKAMREHLKHRLKLCMTKPIEKDYLIYAFNNRKEEWFPNNEMQTKLKSYSRRSKYIGKTIETEIDINSNHYLLFGLNTGKLRGYSFYALYPYENIQSQLTKTTIYIIALILLFIVVALAIGYMISDTLLKPISQLENGVNAIKARNTQFRIESLQNDEFGRLAERFNTVLSNLKEIELAHNIQDSLLPKNIPLLDGYELSFSNKMASGIGGDYFDTFLLDENNLCIIIGDVSGHGVASALVMAIAKAVFYHGFKNTRDLPILFSKLNSVINTYFGKPPVKKMITLFATIINLSTGNGTFLDAGHNFPFKISPEGNITELKMVGLPIGVLKKMRKQKIDEYVLEKGESLVFYTDGIVEATGKTEEQYGYDRFKANLSRMANYSSESIKANLLSEYEKWENGTEPDDDVTLVILKRLSS